MHEPTTLPAAAEAEGFFLREAIACLLGSQVPFEMAHAAVVRLETDRVLGGGVHARRLAGPLTALLGSPLTPGYPRRYRFPKAGGERLARFFAWYSALPGGLLALLDSRDAHALRAHLAGARIGLGPKQASLFLRNVGRAQDLAVLDVHVMRFLGHSGLVTDLDAPGHLGAYERLEDRLRAYALGWGQPLGRFDLAIWVVMRQVGGAIHEPGHVGLRRSRLHDDGTARQGGGA